MRFRVLAVAACLIVCGSACGSASRVEKAAARFFPAELSNGENAHSSGFDSRHWDLVEADLDLSGNKDYLIVAYSNGSSGSVRVLRRSPDGYSVASDSPVHFLERAPTIELADLNADRRPEIIVSYLLGNRSIQHSWILVWRDGALRCGSTLVETECPDYVHPVFIDLDGDGIDELIEPGEEHGVNVEFVSPEEAEEYGPVTANRESLVYRQHDGIFTGASEPIQYFNVFRRGKGSPEQYVDTFVGGTGDFVLRAFPIGADGRVSIDSAEVIVNGHTIFTSSSLMRKNAVFEAPLTLRDKNTIAVKLLGKPGDELRIVIAPISVSSAVE